MSTIVRRNALLALLIIAPAQSLGSAASLWIWQNEFGNAVYAVFKAILYGLPVVWLLFVDHQPISWSPPKKGGFRTGVVLGILISAFILAVWYLSIRHDLDPSKLKAAAEKNSFDTPLKFLLLGGFITVVNSLMEEYVFRWFIFTRCRQLMPTLPAVIVAGLIFTAHHIIVLRAFVPWRLTIEAAAGVFVGGVVWSWMYHRFGSVWPCWVSHMIVDAAIIWIGWQILFVM